MAGYKKKHINNRLIAYETGIKEWKLHHHYPHNIDFFSQEEKDLIRRYHEQNTIPIIRATNKL